MKIAAFPNFARYESSFAILSDELNKNNVDLFTIDEERLLRIKHTYNFPLLAMEYCLKQAKLKNIKNFHIDYNKVELESDYSFLNPNDQDFVLNCYNHADVCISVTSSSMVEMILSGKPSINFLYGDWVLDSQKIKMKDFILHHLEKLYSYNIIKHVYSFENLINEINNHSPIYYIQAHH